MAELFDDLRVLRARLSHRDRIAPPKKSRAVSRVAHVPPQQALLDQAQRALAAQWTAITQLMQLCIELGMRLFVVGGQVRDLLLDAVRARPAARRTVLGDVDLVVEGDAQVLARAAVDVYGGTLLMAHNAFLTARWQPAKGWAIDLATARSERYLAPAALPQVACAGLTEDLCRRDFSINAMALGLGRKEAGQLFDPYGGFDDLQLGQLRVLHSLSFQHDPTRLLRAARFAARLDMELAPDTQSLMRAALRANIFKALTPTRLGAQLDLIFNEPKVMQIVCLMRDWGLFNALEFGSSDDHLLIDNLEAAYEARQQCHHHMDVLPRQSEVLWLALAQSLPYAWRRSHSGWIVFGGAALRRFLYGPQQLQQALEAFCGQDRHRRNDVLSRLDEVERVCLFAKLSRPEHKADLGWWESSGRHLRSVVSGRELLQMGYPQSPAYKVALTAALHAAQDGLEAEAQLDAAKAVLNASVFSVSARVKG